MLAVMTTPAHPSSDPLELADAVIAAIQPLQAEIRAAWPDSRASQMVAALLIGASHVRAEVVQAQAGNVRPPKTNGLIRSLIRPVSSIEELAR